MSTWLFLGLRLFLHHKRTEEIQKESLRTTMRQLPNSAYALGWLFPFADCFQKHSISCPQK